MIEQSLRNEAAWVLCNVASGTTEQCQVLVDCAAPSVLVAGALQAKQSFAETCLNALGNLAGDTRLIRNALLDAGALPAFFKIASSPNAAPKNVQMAVWALSNTFKHPLPNVYYPAGGESWAKEVQPYLPVFTRLLHSDDEDTKWNMCCGISRLLKAGDAFHKPMVEEEFLIDRLIELVQVDHKKIASSALTALGEILAGDAGFTGLLIGKGILPVLRGLLKHEDEFRGYLAAWSICKSGFERSERQLCCNRETTRSSH